MRAPPKALPAALVAAALLLLAAPAWAQKTSGQAQGSRALEPGNVLHPLPVSLAKGDGFAVHFKVTDPPGAILYFSFHEHVGAQQVNIEALNTSEMTRTFTAPHDGLFSILWENNGDNITSFDYDYHTVRASANATPFPGAALAVAVVAGAALAFGGKRGGGRA